MTEPADRFFVSQRLRLHYAEWGAPDAPPLILIHGGRDHARSWDALAATFASQWRIIAPDLRGHGDSEWASDGSYEMVDFTYDLAELVRHLELGPVPIVGHSLGGNIAVRFAGLYPEAVKKLVAIEGLGPSPAMSAESEAQGVADRMRHWIAKRRTMDRRSPRRYATLHAAIARMQVANAHLTPELARHLTIHGARIHEDGSASFKFDPAMGVMSPVDFTTAEKHELWAAISCPTLLVYGRESWASNPDEDGRARHFRNARVEMFDDAGHWVHHDRLPDFIKMLGEFL